MRIVRVRRPLSLLFMLLFVAPALALMGAAGCAPRSAPAISSPPVAAAGAGFVGSAACADCHRAEYDLQHASRHAVTMRRADLPSLGGLAPPRGPIARSGYAVREAEGGLRFERLDRPDIGTPIQFALGSGKYAMTYISDVGAQSLTELRMTFLPAKRVWCVTPGQGALANLNLGDKREMGVARKCVLCHASATEPDSAAPAANALGVGCESCHGPGSGHIEAMKAGHSSDLKIERFGKAPVAKIEATCSRCHRSLDDVPIDKDDPSQTARFQGYGLEQSACYKKSGRLSCITCHDPHASLSTNRAAYERVCLSCHSSTAAVHGKECPVNKRDRCVDCHMPQRVTFPDQHIGITMADHRIMAYRGKR